MKESNPPYFLQQAEFNHLSWWNPSIRRGDDSSDLSNESPTDVLVDYEISMISSDGDIHETNSRSEASFRKAAENGGWGRSNFVKRENIYIKTMVSSRMALSHS